MLELNFKHLCYFCLSLPLLAFLACVALSIYKDFDAANRTHCRVANILPSVSACISSFYPQSTIWRLCIGLDSFPRYLIAFIYYRAYYTRIAANRTLIRLALLLHLIELTALLTLTFVSSTEIFVVHAASFCVFIAASSAYMIITLAVHWPLKHRRRSLDLKLKVFSFYALSFVASLYFYVRHNSYCEPYIYSLFSLCEYFTILGNIAYHSLIIYDLNLDLNPRRIVLID